MIFKSSQYWNLETQGSYFNVLFSCSIPLSLSICVHLKSTYRIRKHLSFQNPTCLNSEKFYVKASISFAQHKHDTDTVHRFTQVRGISSHCVPVRQSSVDCCFRVRCRAYVSVCSFRISPHVWSSESPGEITVFIKLTTVKCKRDYNEKTIRPESPSLHSVFYSRDNLISAQL